MTCTEMHAALCLPVRRWSSLCARESSMIAERLVQAAVRSGSRCIVWPEQLQCSDGRWFRPRSAGAGLRRQRPAHTTQQCAALDWTGPAVHSGLAWRTAAMNLPQASLQASTGLPAAIAENANRSPSEFSCPIIYMVIALAGKHGLIQLVRLFTSVESAHLDSGVIE